MDQPPHHLIRPWNPLHLRAQLIDGAKGLPFCYGSLPPPDMLPNGVYPQGLHCLHYQGVIPLSSCPSFCCHPRAPLRRLVVEIHQDLEHLPHHHQALSALQYHQLLHRLIN